MENTDNTDGSSSGAYDKLIYQDECRIEEHSFRNNQDQLQVSVMGPGPSLRYYRLAVVCLGLLGALLLVIDIGLGIYYKKLSDGNLEGNGASHIGNELTILLDTYKNAIQARDEAKKQLATEISEKQLTSWELDHQQTRSKDYSLQIENIQQENALALASLPLIKDGCKHCSSGWLLLNSKCYYLPLTENFRRTSWQRAREMCQRRGADLVVIDSLKKQLSLSKVIYDNRDPSMPIHQTGFWIGLRDVQEEGTWRWLDGTTMIEGYWNEGEPNDYDGGEDCAAIYPRENPFHAWNDAPCTHPLRWICEMSPRSTT